jgi:hypothetical protein
MNTTDTKRWPTINTDTEWLEQAAIALRTKDLDLLDWVEGATNGWMQSEEERDAQLGLIEAIREAIEEAA